MCTYVLGKPQKKFFFSGPATKRVGGKGLATKVFFAASLTLYYKILGMYVWETELFELESERIEIERERQPAYTCSLIVKTSALYIYKKCPLWRPLTLSSIWGFWTDISKCSDRG